MSTRFVTRDVATPGFTRALAAALVAVVVGFGVGYASMRGVVTDTATSAGTGGAEFAGTLRSILSRNFPAALLLYSGVSTLGISTVLALILLGGFVGGTFATAVSAVGMKVAASSIIVYAPVEMLGFLLAAVAGLTPIAATLSRSAGESRTRLYLGSLSGSLRTLGAASILLLVAGVLEAIVISNRA